jgi:formamidopyrimidine-DNA glycosylase
MPELPEVETVARDLRGLVVGATITGARYDWPRTIAGVAPEAFEGWVAGRRIEAVGRRAKFVLLDLSGGLVLTIQLKMTGQVFVVPAGASADRHVRVVIDLEDGRELRFRDMRKFGRVGVYRRDADGRLVPPDAAGSEVPVRRVAEAKDPSTPKAGISGSQAKVAADLFGRHGPEPLSDEFTLRVFRARLRRRRGRLKPLLLDQSFVAGVGNIYADEALWLARLHPLRRAEGLRPPDEARLYRAIRSVLAEAIERRGSSVDDYTAPEGDGTMQERLAVYQRTGLPCFRDGHPIRRIVIGARSTHFCSFCQRLPAADRAGAAAILRAGRESELGAQRRVAATRKAAATRRRGVRWSELPAGEGIVGRGRSGGVPSTADRDALTAERPS